MKRILVINDSRFENMIMKDNLMDMGYDVEVTNEYNALIKIKEFSPNIVITNLIMKNTTGDRLIEKIKTKNPKVICILSSCDQIELENFKNNKVDEIIHTPASKTQLSEVLNRVSHNEQINKDDIDIIFQSLAIKRDKGQVGKRNRGSKVDKLNVFNSINNEVNIIDEIEVSQRTGEVNSMGDFLFCPYCGSKLSSAEKNFKYCPYCGHNLE
jgi:response regulator RpfG family c-di-GMP phosphodiesterase